MADFGLNLALNTRPRDWGQVRQDRLMEVQMLKQMQTDLQSRIEKEAQARAGVVEYMSQIQKASVLSQDIERVKAVEAEERKKIVAGIQKAGNNYQKFLLGDGAAIMNSYYNNVMTSDAMVKAQKNKLNYAQASLDDYLGRWQRPVTDSKGNQISFKEAQAAFEKGDTDVLDYQGSIQAPDMLKMQQIIQSTYGKDRYRKQPANKEDIYNLAIRSGAEDWAAKQIAEGYEGGVQSGAEPLYFKWDEPKQTSGYGMKALDALLKSQPQMALYSALNGVAATKVGDTKDVGNGIYATPYYTTLNQADLKNAVMKLVPFEKIKDGDGEKLVYTQPAIGAKSGAPLNIAGANIDLSQAAVVTEVYQDEKGNQKPIMIGNMQFSGQPYLEFDVWFDSKGDAREAGALAARNPTVFESISGFMNPNAKIAMAEKGIFQGGEGGMREEGNFAEVKDKGYGGRVRIPISPNMSELTYGESRTAQSNQEDYMKLFLMQALSGE